jgi:hypothetical protein
MMGVKTPGCFFSPQISNGRPRKEWAHALKNKHLGTLQAFKDGVGQIFHGIVKKSMYHKACLQN